MVLAPTAPASWVLLPIPCGFRVPSPAHLASLEKFGPISVSSTPPKPFIVDKLIAGRALPSQSWSDVFCLVAAEKQRAFILI